MVLAGPSQKPGGQKLCRQSLSYNDLKHLIATFIRREFLRLKVDKNPQYTIVLSIVEITLC